jgi:hypothetical protein
MKNANEVLRRKELEIERVKGEIEALRVAAKLLRDKGDPPLSSPKKLGKVLSIR